ncbi:thioredoxin O2, mitochondrial [Mangifera indica]|uniref:thioredoxin O2, mitochondrial n=1 Tax=Mangifera indica TaxID=29780 RepID=UPI001CF9D82A|nr:thioredoxin O2, mitochondrial [Mangifera indica]
MRGNAVSIVLQRFLLHRQVSFLGSSQSQLKKTLISASKSFSSPTSVSPKIPISNNHISAFSTQKIPCFQLQRTLCSSPDGASKIVLIKSGEEFDSSLSKVKDDSMPAIFYFTAVWCGPCRFLSPVMEELSAKYPHVKTYKIDIDQEGLGSTLGKLNITAVPTLLFFNNGKKAAEIIGADVARLKDTMEKLYKKN